MERYMTTEYQLMENFIEMGADAEPEEIEAAKRACRKQLPKSLEKECLIKDNGMYVCACGRKIRRATEKFCGTCGQRICWK